MDSSTLPNLSDDARPSIYAAMGFCFPIAVITVLLRVIARRLTGTKLWLDDFLIFVALAFDLGFLICTAILVDNGLGRHVELATMAQITVFLKTYIPAGSFYASSISWTKLSILAFYWRIFSTLRTIRPPIYILGVIVICWNIAVVCVTIFSCTPVAYWWDKTIPGGHCVNNFAFLLGNSIPNICTDLLILVLPLPFIWRLQQSQGKKLALSGVFLLAGFVCVVTIIRLVIQLRTNFSAPDITWNISDFVKWTNVETSLAIVSACLPSLRPIILFLHDSYRARTLGSGLGSNVPLHAYSEQGRSQSNKTRYSGGTELSDAGKTKTTMSSGDQRPLVDMDDASLHKEGAREPGSDGFGRAV